MNNVNIDDFISKVDTLYVSNLLHGFKVGDCVKVTTVCFHGKRHFTLVVLGSITNISFNNSLLSITVKDCCSNIDFVFHSFDDFQKFECKPCKY